MKYWRVISFGVLFSLISLNGEVAGDVISPNAEVPEVLAVPLADLKVRVEKDEKDGKWYAIFESTNWRIVGNSYSRKGKKSGAKLMFGEFVGVRDPKGCVARRVLEVEVGSPAQLYIRSGAGTEILMLKFDGKSWITAEEQEK